MRYNQIPDDKVGPFQDGWQIGAVTKDAGGEKKGARIAAMTVLPDVLSLRDLLPVGRKSASNLTTTTEAEIVIGKCACVVCLCN